MHGEEKEEEGEEEEDTRKCIRFESYSQHGIGFSFASRCWKLEGGTNWRGVAWLAGWLAFCSMLRAAFCGLRIPSCTTRGKTPLQHRDKSRGARRRRWRQGKGGGARGAKKTKGEGSPFERKKEERKKEKRKRSAEGRRRRWEERGKYGGGQKDIRRN